VVVRLGCVAVAWVQGRLSAISKHKRVEGVSASKPVSQSSTYVLEGRLDVFVHHLNVGLEHGESLAGDAWVRVCVCRCGWVGGGGEGER